MSLFKERQYLRIRMDRDADDSLWMKCTSCGEMVFKRRVRENNNVCPNCGEYFFLTAPERVESLLDPGSIEDITKPIVTNDPLGFSDAQPYAARVAEAQELTSLGDAIVVARGAIEGIPVVLGAMDFRFIGGSMGCVMGEQICHAIETAISRRAGFVLISSSGGARIQEGTLSLFQMAKTVSSRRQLAEARLPFVSVMTYPTSGGVQASIASLGDVLIAERGALIGFAGRRVIQQTIAQELPAHFQTEAFALERGQIDRVVRREDLRSELALALGFFMEAR
ncbi:MAG: acetyl-CoA carboxylase, carboxyltransferase subunit beta [Candidatus Bipolaricaulota bacterium]